MPIIVTQAQVLSALKAMQIKVRDPRQGICSNLDWQLWMAFGSGVDHESYLGNGELASSIIPDLSQKWPKFSGFPAYPVPVPEGSNPLYTCMEMYDSVLNKWEGEYGELRRELLQFLIEELENRRHA